MKMNVNTKKKVSIEPKSEPLKQGAVSSSKNLLTDYHWIRSGCAGSIKAKNMKDACKKAIWAQMPANPNKYDKEKLYFNEMKVVKGKLPKYW